MPTKLQERIANAASTVTQFLVKNVEGAYQGMLHAKSRKAPSYSLGSNVAAEMLQSTCAIVNRDGSFQPDGGPFVAGFGAGTRNKGNLWQQIVSQPDAESTLLSVLISRVIPDKNALMSAHILSAAFAKQADMIEYTAELTGDPDFAKAIASVVSALERFVGALYELDKKMPAATKAGTLPTSWQDYVGRSKAAKENASE